MLLTFFEWKMQITVNLTMSIRLRTSMSIRLRAARLGAPYFFHFRAVLMIQRYTRYNSLHVE